MSPKYPLYAWARLAALGLGLALACCSSNTASIEQSWRSPEARPGELQNVAVVFVSTDGTIRRTIEDSVARQLASRGVRAVPGYTIVTGDEVHDRARAVAKLRAAGVNGVITIRVVSKEQKLEYVPGFDDYWDYAWPDAYPGSYIPETVVRIETSAYSLDNGKLIWSALSESVDPDNIGKLADNLGKVVAGNLAKQGLLAG